MKEGDRNTIFFHLTTLKHRANNRITNIVKGQVQVTKEDEIEKEVVCYFSSLLSVDHSLSGSDQEEILVTIPPILQVHHNSMLKAIPSLEEIHQALFSLPGDKAPGLDGFPTFFFQVFWNVVKKDVAKVVQDFFGARNLLKELNATFLVLIPKILGADSLDKFRTDRKSVV